MISYTKLQSGSWGVRVTGDAPRAGQTITVTKKGGGTKREVIARVVWSGNGVHLCAIEQQHSRPKSVCYSCGCEFRGHGDYCGC